MEPLGLLITQFNSRTNAPYLPFYLRNLLRVGHINT